MPVHRSPRGGFDRRAIVALLQRAQAILSTRLVEHVGEKLLKGEDGSHESTYRYRFEGVLLMHDLHTVGQGFQAHIDPMTNQLRGDVVSREIDADHAMSIHFARRCSTSRVMSQLSGSTLVGRAGKGAGCGKATVETEMPLVRSKFEYEKHGISKDT